MRDFTNYEVWKEAIQTTVNIYKITNNFPTEEKFGLISQVRRASVSISSNIAEGCSRSSEKDFSRFIEIALGSLFEVKSQLLLSSELEFTNTEDIEGTIASLDTLGKRLNALRSKLKTK